MILFFLLQLKHLIIDFIWQPEYEWRNKGTFGHWGGIRHSGKHALATLLILLFIVPVWVALLIAALEGIAHYFIDFYKMNANEQFGYVPDKPEFWYLLGLDQFLHQICYGLIITVVAVMVF